MRADDRKHRDCTQAIKGGEMGPPDDAAKESTGGAYGLDVLH
jgi:hypothetical protein